MHVEDEGKRRCQLWRVTVAILVLLLEALLIADSFAARPVVPATHPVKGKYDVGVYYYPGWKSGSRWAPIMNYPERQPLLGWYAEGDPRIAEWQIKWAAEHGITFFAYDWYWCKGSRSLEHALHDGFLKARNRDKMKFCLLWANHNPDGSHSLDDSTSVARHWVKSYFKRPEYYRINGKPVVILFSPYRLREDLGGPEGARRALDVMRAECRAAGLPGLYVVACVSKSEVPRASAEGYDALSCYNWPSLGMAKGTKEAPFETMAEGYRQWWEEISATCSVPLMTPISGGWDDRPWAGEKARVRFGMTPEKFRKHLQDAKALMDRGTTSVLPVALIEAWNEFGEGSYIEPEKEHRFAYLDAVRQVFTDGIAAHRDLVPEDVHTTVAQVRRLVPGESRWSFGKDSMGWEISMGMTDQKVSRGVLSAVSVSRDPAFGSPVLALDAAQFQGFRVQMKHKALDGKPFKDSAQFFWADGKSGMKEDASVRFEVNGDGKWHEYRAPVSGNAEWAGEVRQLRFDPCTRPDVTVELRLIEVERKR